jgi:hypothetical protein
VAVDADPFRLAARTGALAVAVCASLGATRNARIAAEATKA